MNDIRVSNWSELNEALYAGSWQPSIGRFRPNYAFHGVCDASDDLRTGLMRLGGDYAQMETHLLRNFRKYAGNHPGRSDSVWDWLALAQHHGLPTRLQDWTYSPFVALHFATDDPDQFGLDGAVWMVDYASSNALLPAKLKAVLDDEDADVFTAEMLARVASNLQEFDAIGGEPFVAFFEPPSLDDRIVNQYALFTLMSSPIARLDEWVIRHPDFVRKVVVPAALKWEVRDKLDQANIDERVLFPGLDGLSRWLRRYYTPRTDRPTPPGSGPDVNPR